MRLEVIIGRVRVGRIGPSVADWFVDRATADGRFDVGILDLAQWPLPDDLSKSETSENFTARIGSADAFVVVTPEYNHGYPAALKTALDSVKHQWRAKPVGFVSYGGVSGGLRAVEQLRVVASELHMVSTRDTVSFHGARRGFDPLTHDDGGAAADAATRLIDQLHWWSESLATSRSTYPG